MTKEIVAIASDHAGFEMKQFVKSYLMDKGFEVMDLGPESNSSVDYPDYGHALGNAMDDNKASKGVAICGSGIGISIAVNRHKGARAALCQNALMAKLSRQHNNANVLALGARLIGPEVAIDCLDAFFGTEFEGGRHAGRVAKI